MVDLENYNLRAIKNYVEKRGWVELKRSYLQRVSVNCSLLWNPTIVVDRVDSNPVLCAWTQTSHLEDWLIGADIDNHLMILRIKHLK